MAVLIHGGYWRNPYGCDLMHPMAARLVSLGWTVLNVEYRRIGEVEDPWPAMAADLVSAGRLTAPGSVLIGHSAGGHLALWLSGQSSGRNHQPYQGVVALAPLADLDTADRLELSNHATSELFGLDAEQRSKRILAASPHRLVPLGVHQLVVHGDADENVPQSISDAYVRAAREAGDDVVYFDPAGVDHFQIIDPTTTIWSEIEAVLETWSS